MPEDVRGVDLYATLGDRNDLSGLRIDPEPSGDGPEFKAAWR